MPTLGAALIASVAGWLIDGLFRPFFGASTTLVLSLLGSTVIYVLVRRWLLALRGG